MNPWDATSAMQTQKNQYRLLMFLILYDLCFIKIIKSNDDALR